MHPHNRNRRQKYNTAKYFGATSEQARFARQLSNERFDTILRFLTA